MAKDTTAIAILPAAESVRQVFTTANGLDPYLAQIRAELDKFKGTADVTTKKGRDAIASMAYRVAKGKTAIDEMGKNLVAEMKKEPALVDAERKRTRDLLDLWKDEIRQPLTDWEKAEADRQQRHRDRIAEIQNAGRDLDGFDSDMLAHRLAEVEEIVVDEKYEEFTAEVAMVKDRTVKALRTALDARVKYENEQAELARLRQEAAAREQKDREERIAREAAESAQREADAKARAERDAATRREAEAAAAAERRELELRLANEKAEREKAETLQRLQEAKAEAERRAQQAVEDERRRAAAAKAEEEEAARRREADRAHKTRINRAALDAFVAGGLSEECARTAITLIAKRSIPAISITY